MVTFPLSHNVSHISYVLLFLTSLIPHRLSHCRNTLLVTSLTSLFLTCRIPYGLLHAEHNISSFVSHTIQFLTSQTPHHFFCLTHHTVSHISHTTQYRFFHFHTTWFLISCTPFLTSYTVSHTSLTMRFLTSPTPYLFFHLTQEGFHISRTTPFITSHTPHRFSHLPHLTVSHTFQFLSGSVSGSMTSIRQTN